VLTGIRLNTLEGPRPNVAEWIESALDKFRAPVLPISLAREIAHAAKAKTLTIRQTLRPGWREALSAVEPLFPMAASPPQLQCDEI